MLVFLWYILLLLACFSSVECAKILGVFHIPGPSHYLATNTLMRVLAEKGHEVTIVSGFSDKNAPPNVKQIVLTGLPEQYTRSIIPNMFEISTNSILCPLVVYHVTISLLEKIFNHTEFQKLMQSDVKFDAVVIEEYHAQALKYVAYHFNAPLIVFNSIYANEWVNPYQGNPDSPAYVPSLFFQHVSSEMSFLERAESSLHYIYSSLLRNFMVIPMQNKLLHKYFPDAPHLNDFIYNVSLVLLNSDHSVYEALQKVPSMVDIGGFHIKKPKPSLDDLQQVMDTAKNGVILFSLGTNFRSNQIPIEKRQFLMRTFSKLEETVIWKFEDEYLPGKPDNVIIRKWLPQNDILAHKNMKLFITHDGIFSIMEAVYHGVPILALPVWAEQNANARRATYFGFGKYVPFKKMTEKIFNTHLTDLLQNPKYKQNAKKRSRILNDKPIPATQALSYWVEYVIRHKGAPHLKVAALNLTWYQYLLLDVIVFILVISITLIYIIKISFKLVFR